MKKQTATGYVERHHILPKSMFVEYKNSKENMVLLKYEDHIEAHRLLNEIFQTRGMMIAYYAMTGKDPKNLSKGDLNPAKRDDVREKISRAKTGKPRIDMIGKKYFGASDETIAHVIQVAKDTHSGKVCVVDKSGKRFKVSVDDERYISGELVSFNTGSTRVNSASKRPDVMNKIMNTRNANYEKFSGFTFDEMVDYIVSAHYSGKKIFAKTKPFERNYSSYIKRTEFDQNELKIAVVQRLEKDGKSESSIVGSSDPKRQEPK